jgi:hypothetical protein
MLIRKRDIVFFITNRFLVGVISAAGRGCRKKVTAREFHGPQEHGIIETVTACVAGNIWGVCLSVTALKV